MSIIQDHQNERTVNLKNMMWSIMNQWKAILGCCLICTLLLPALGYYRESVDERERIVEAERTIKMAENADAEIESILGSLPSPDKESVRAAIWQYTSIVECIDYIDKSKLLNINLNKATMFTIGFAINADVEENLPDLYYTCIAGFDSESLLNSIGEALGLSEEPEYIRELISYNNFSLSNDSYPEYNVLNISIIVPENGDYEKLSNNITKELEQRLKQSLLSSSGVEVKKIYEERNTSASSFITTRKAEASARLYSLRSNYNNYLLSLTAEQKSTVDKIVKLIDLKKQYTSRNNMQAERIINDSTNQPSIYYLKLAALGCVMGIFVYILIYSIIQNLRKRITSVEDIQYYLNERIIGQIYIKSNDKHLKSFLHSDAVFNVKHGDVGSFRSQAERCAKEILAICNRLELARLTVVTITNGCAHIKQDYTNLLSEFNGKGLNIRTVAYDCQHKELISKEVENVLIVVSNNIKVSSLLSLARDCNDYNYRVIGIVYLEIM